MEEMIEGLIAKAGLSQEQAEAVVQFLKENADKVPGWLGVDLKDMASKLPGGLGGLLG